MVFPLARPIYTNDKLPTILSAACIDMAICVSPRPLRGRGRCVPEKGKPFRLHMNAPSKSLIS